MQTKLHIPSVFELSLGDYSTSGAAICCSRDGTKLTFTIGPMTDVTVVALGRVAERHGTISLNCYGSTLLFALVSLERKEPNKVRIVGRVCCDTLSAARIQEQCDERFAL